MFASRHFGLRFRAPSFLIISTEAHAVRAVENLSPAPSFQLAMVFTPCHVISTERKQAEKSIKSGEFLLLKILHFAQMYAILKMPNILNKTCIKSTIIRYDTGFVVPLYPYIVLW